MESGFTKNPERFLLQDYSVYSADEKRLQWLQKQYVAHSKGYGKNCRDYASLQGRV